MLTKNFVFGVLLSYIALFMSIMLTLVYCIAIHMEEGNDADLDFFEENENDSEPMHTEIPKEI